MTITTVLPIWQALHDRFLNMVKALPEENLSLKLGTASIGYMIRHTAEVEYMFAKKFFGKAMPENLKFITSRGEDSATPPSTDLNELIELLTSSNSHLIEAMHELPEEAWQTPVVSTMGTSTPLEAVGRLMYHAGIHAGQISIIQKKLLS